MDAKNQSTIQSLQHELQAAKSANPELTENVDRLSHELNEYITVPNTERLERLPALQKALQDAIESFEGHHPALTEALRIAINTLVNAGI